MTLRTATTAAAALLGVLASSSAFAAESTIQPPIAPPPDAAAARESTQAPPRFTAGLQLELLPQGQVDLAVGSMHQSQDLTTAFGLGGLFAFDLLPNFSLGAAPRVLFHVNTTTGSTNAMTEYDLRARVAVHGRVVDNLSLYAFGEPGYSWIVPDEGDHMNGFVVAFGGGASVDLSPEAFVSAEVGYQLGFQSFELAGVGVDSHFDYLHLGFAGGARF